MPLTVLEDGQANLAVFIERDAVAILEGGLPAPIFAPRRAAFFVGDPERIVFVIRQSRAGFVVGCVRDRTSFAGLASLVELADPNVVVTFLISIPGDGHLAIVRRGYRGCPT